MAGVIYTIDFAAGIARLEEGTVKGARAVRKMADEMETASNFAKKALASIGVGLSGAAFIAAIKSAADAADAAAKMGDRFGIATEQLIGMQHAANLAGVSNEGLTTALRGLAKSGVEAAQGNEAARTAFERLHIQASEFLKLPMDRQLSLVIDRLGMMENAAVRNATAQALMGRNAGEMMGLVAEGSQAFEEAAADTLAWGLAIDRVDAAKIEMANDAIKRAEAATKGLFSQISIHLSPTIIELANQFADAAKETRGFKDQVSFLDDGLKAAASLALAAQDIFFGLGHQIGAVGAAIAALLGGEFASAYNIIEGANADVLQHTVETNAAIDRVWKATGTSIDEEAKRIAARRQAMMKEGGDPGITPFDSYKAGLAQQLGALIEHNRNEFAVVEAHYAQKQALLDESVAKGIITDDFWQGQSMLLFADYEAAKTRLEDEETKKRYGISKVYRQLDLDSASAFLGQMGAMMSSHSRAAFNIGKAAAIADTIIQTYRGAQGAFASLASVNLYAAVAAAAAAVVVGLARVQQIRATQFDGGAAGGATPVFSANPVTGIPTGSIGVPGTPVAPVQGVAAPAPTNVHIYFEGGEDRSYSYQEVAEEIIPLINEAIGNGINITVSTT